MTTTEQTQTSQRIFEATVTREGRWWTITVPALDAVTQARSIKEVQLMATEVVAALLDVEPREVSVTLTYELPANVASAWREAEALRVQAEQTEERAAALRRDAVRTLLSETHMSQTEAGVVLGLSKQRVQQLAS